MFQDWKQLENYILNRDYDPDLSKYKNSLLNIDELKKYYLLPSQFIYVIDLSELSLVYVSDEVENVLNYKPFELTYKSFIDFVHIDDLSVVQKKIFTAFDYFYRNLTKIHIMDIFSIEYRFKTKNRGYINLLRNSLVKSYDKLGNPIHILSVVTDLCHVNQSNNLMNYITDVTKDSDSNIDLSIRETEIVALVAKGKTSREIAKELFISHHTVEKHRKNILRKNHINNFTELVSKAKERKII